MAWSLWLLSLGALFGGLAAHPCEAEVISACPERPPAELATCLKTPAEHETETTLSSECMDFVALNKACAEDIAKSCDEAFFSEDTIPCLTSWTEPENLSEKCSKTLKWAVPQAGSSEDEGDGPTDELGMSDKDRAEKAEWQAKRRAEREKAMERMKMKEVDKKKEEERVELEKFKADNPDAYAEMQKQKEEDKRQAQEQKRRERLMAAALERQRREREGGDEEDQAGAQAGKKKRPGAAKSKGGSRIWFFLLVALAIGGGGYYYMKSSKKGSKKGAGGSGNDADAGAGGRGSSSSGKKKKRG